MDNQPHRGLHFALKRIYPVAGILGVLFALAGFYGTGTREPEAFERVVSPTMMALEPVLRFSAILLSIFFILVAFAVRALVRARTLGIGADTVLLRDVEAGPGALPDAKSSLPSQDSHHSQPPIQHSASEASLLHPPCKYYACIDCPAMFQSANHLSDHMEDDHGWEQYPLRYSCVECRRPFEDPAAMREHMRITHGWFKTLETVKIEFACVDCPMAFCDKYDLRVHMERVHERLRTVPNRMFPYAQSTQFNISPGVYHQPATPYGGHQLSSAHIGAPPQAAWPRYSEPHGAAPSSDWSSMSFRGNHVEKPGTFVPSPTYLPGQANAFPNFRTDSDINFERDFGQWFNPVEDDSQEEYSDSDEEEAAKEKANLNRAGMADAGRPGVSDVVQK